MSYKDPKSFKGFEYWLQSVKMTLKMYVYTFAITAAIQAALVVLYLFVFQHEFLRAFVYVFVHLKFKYWIPAIKDFFGKSLFAIVLTAPIYIFSVPIFVKYFKSKAENIVKDMHLRGAKLANAKELQKKIFNDIKKEMKENKIFYASKKDEFCAIGDLPVPLSAETRHFLVLGKPGAGKTTLLKQIIETLRYREEKVIIHDPKGDYLSSFYDSSKDIIFNPLDKRCVNWCIFKEIRMYADVDSVAASMIPPSNRDDRFWVDAARDVFSAILYYLKYTNQETNAAIWEHVTKTEEEMLEIMQQASSVGIENAKKALGYLQGFKAGTKVASDVLATMRQYTNCFQYMTHLKNSFSIKDFIESSTGGFIFVSNFVNLKDTLKPALTLFLDTTLKHNLSLPDSRTRRTFFILDEFANLQRLNSIITSLEMGRSKGMSIWIATQDINQIQKLYSQETMNTIINTTGTVVAFAMNDYASCEYISKILGEREIVETDESVSMGPSVDIRDGMNMTRRRKTERLVLPSEISSLKDLECYVKMLSYDVTKTIVEFKKYDEKEPSFVLNDIFSLSGGQPPSQ